MQAASSDPPAPTFAIAIGEGGDFTACGQQHAGQEQVVFGQCIACAAPRKNERTRFCLIHDNVQRQMNRNVGKDCATPEEAKAQVKAHKEAMQDDMCAAMKVRDWQAKNPSMKAGKKAAPFDHVNFLQTYKATTYVDTTVKCKRMNLKDYMLRMKAKKDWTPARSEEEWNKMRVDPNIEQYDT